jgi:hypothetical protein
MADEANSTTEEIVGQVEEGSVASLEVETEEAPEVVPARDLLRVKEQRDTYKSQLKEKDDLIKSLQSKNQDTLPDDDLSEFTDLDPAFKRKWEAKDKKAEIIAEQIVEKRLAEERKKIDFERKLETTIDKQLEVARQNGVRIPTNFDRNLFKTIVLSQPKTDIAVLAERTW